MGSRSDLALISLGWNVSQNVGRTDVIPLPGITGCITPGGEHFGPHRGRCILGYEKLLLSGIPADKLLLGTESEVQLSDLAATSPLASPRPPPHLALISPSPRPHLALTSPSPRP